MKKSIFISFLFLSIFGRSQNWESVGGGSNYEVRALYSDTINNILLIGGNFTMFGDSTFVQSVYWDGNTIHKMGVWGDTICTVYGCNHVLSFAYYNNTYYAGGTFNLTAFGAPQKYLVKWNGNDWISAGNVDAAVTMSVTNNNLFAMGIMTEIDGVQCKDIVKWNDSVWEPFYSISPNVNDQVWCIKYYQGKYYIAGNFNEPNGFNEIVSYDGNQVFSLDSGLLGGWAIINDLEVYQGLLWVGGYFFASDGNVSDFIAVWDGQNWINPFPGIYYINQVYDLEVINNELYITGQFVIPNDTASYGIAHYDGTNFCAFGGPAYYPEYPDIREVEGLNGDIYVTCNKVLFGDTVNYIAKYIGTQDDTCVNMPLDIKKINSGVNEILKIYPNPANNIITISATNAHTPFSYVVRNLIGQTIANGNFLSETILNIESWEKGIYFISISDSQNHWSKKVIKQ